MNYNHLTENVDNIWWMGQKCTFLAEVRKKRLHISGTFNFFDLLIISREVGWVGECRDSACPRYHFFVAFDLILLDFFCDAHSKACGLHNYGPLLFKLNSTCIKIHIE